jgi:hypothetical protein
MDWCGVFSLVYSIFLRIIVLNLKERECQSIANIYIYIYRVFTKEWCGLKSWQEIYFSLYTNKTYTVSSSNCLSFACATGSSLHILTTGPRDQFPRWRRSRKRLSVCSVLRCPDLWLQCSVSFLHGLELLVDVKPCTKLVTTVPRFWYVS